MIRGLATALAVTVCLATIAGCDDKKDATKLAGRTENMRWVNFDGPQTLINRFADVVITEAMPNSLRGRLA